ncbi:dTDP-6-deoxy-L-talose 4-dehydrogenase [Enhygromyxa salina]|uniref:dTDP-6-deoxy-L-talose 4-dehydrogenase n=1 Tax=Enhygromyxa salina TaxID=215803 RepID=A0A2S9YFG8_9BACT|nr:NAD-dependent epimerase/dehydratase family protein [Enhygromyxa salina]PRQ03854.1 dTDP-6-deoxy-L-talose 4-dehydrogenase [Enhygromyxa salina]
MVNERNGSAAIAVAGGTGFIGRHVVARLLAAGRRVVVLARGRRPLPAMIEAAELRPCDLGAEINAELLADCEVVVNLVGIKRETATMSWEQAHVELPTRLANAAARAKVARMIHVSVAGTEGASPSAGPYLDTKARGEHRLAGEAPLAVTILRPGVVYGRGDDMLRNLADSIRAAPVFPAPRAGRAQVQPIAVEDVAEAVLRCIEGPATRGRAYDLVGPERLELRELVRRVAASGPVGRRCLVAPAPAFMQRAVAAVLERVSEDPLITRSQLNLLAHGVVGDPEPARDELGLAPRVLDDAAITHALAGFEPRLPSVRLVPDPAAARSLGLAAPGASTPAWIFASFAVIAVVALLLGPRLPGSIWLRMAALELGLSALAFGLLRLRWVELWRPSPSALAWGLGAGVFLWAAAFGVAALASALAPGLWSEASSLYAWAEELPLATSLGLLTLIVAGEELVWRGALGVGLAARIGAWPAVAVSASLFTLAHLTTGPPVLALAAALAGGAWAWLAIRTRSLFASFVAHLTWDVTMLWLTPLT